MSSTEAPRFQRGFTLLEVMAAVAIIALVFGILAGHATQGLHAQGVNLRMLEAADIADEMMADLEIGMNEGVIDEIGTEESERDLFRITVDVQPFSEVEVTPGSPPPRDAQGRLPPYDTLEDLMVNESRGFSAALRKITVRVAWDEGSQEMAVVRHTFGLDSVALQALAVAAGATPSDDDSAGDDGAPDDDLDEGRES